MAQNTDPAPSKNIPELVADQIESGDLSCSKSDLLTYEACLLFQGTLGAWQRVGLTENCPSIIDPLLASEAKPKGRQKIHITREDVLKANKSPCFGYLYAINVANTTPILVRTANRIFQMAAIPDFPEPGSDPELCLLARYGSCGNHTAVAMAFFEKAGFKVRSVEFYYEYEGERLSHITPEVFIDGRWRLIDSTYGAYWIDEKPGDPFALMPTDDLFRGKDSKIFYNSALLPYGVWSVTARTNYFSYLSAKADVIRGGVGEISIALKGNRGGENFLHKPNFIGDNKADNQVDGLQFRLRSFLSGTKYRLTVKVSGAAFSSSDSAFICIDQSCELFSKEKNEYEFFVENPTQLFMKTSMDVAYVVMKSLDWEVVRN